MSEAHRNDAPPPPSRRQFMRESAAMAAAGVGIASRAYAGGSDVLRVGLIGCGGRGSGAAANALQADPQVKLVAMGDVFADHLKTRLDALKTQFPEKINVDKDHRFVGFDAYKGVIESSDVVLLASTPHFRQSVCAVAQGHAERRWADPERSCRSFATSLLQSRHRMI